MSQWIQTMNTTATPGIGCWIASYPNPVWDSVPCSNASVGPLTVGNGVDDSANSINYAATSAEGLFTSETGFSSESDSVQGANWYSIQVNTNHYSITFNGHSTTAWEQFAFLNEGGSSNAGYGLVEFWLIGYYLSVGSCPSGWTRYVNNCYLNSNTVTTPYEGPGSLTSYSLTGSTSSTTDTAKFCNSSAGKCYSTTDSDRLSLYSGNWWDTEFNILGFGSSSKANFNAGTSIGLETDNFEPGESCGSVAYSGETNNLSLGTCTGSSTLQYITFSES